MSAIFDISYISCVSPAPDILRANHPTHATWFTSSLKLVSVWPSGEEDGELTRRPISHTMLVNNL